MPSIPSSLGDDAITDDQQELTDDDVAVLHRIITKAQELPHIEQFPLRTLLDAYDAVLAEGRADPDRDPVYFHFLLRLGENGGPESLYAKFEALLARMGITLEFGDETAHGVLEELLVADDGRDGAGEPRPHRGDGGQAARLPGILKPTRRASFSSYQDTIQGTPSQSRRPRRVSFDSAYDAGGETTRKHTPRARLPASPLRHNPHDAWPAHISAAPGADRPYSRSTPDLLGPHAGRQPRTRIEVVLDANGRPTNQVTNRFHAHPIQSGDAIQETLTKHGKPSNIALQRTAPRSNGYKGDLDVGWPRAHNGVSPDYEPQVSMEDLISAAEKAYSNHIARVYRACFLIWRVAALRSHPFHQRLDQEARKYDRRKLLYEAFSCWRNLLHYRRQQMEVRRFFARLERRAVKARNLYLLTKAFTHWAALAREAVQRTALARQHILRLKYFSAWRELAARNELAVREFVLRRYLSRWRQRFALRCRQAADALLLDEYKLLQRAYARLFWGFCERRAPAWFHGISKRKHFTRWADRLQQRRDACRWAEAHYRARLLGQFLHAWRARTRLVAEREAAVARSDRAIVARTVLATWLEQTRLCPVYRRALAMVCYRLARNTFNLWRARTRAERFGAEVDRLRVLRNAWTAWNDRLRWQSLRMRIDDRIVLEALYKWVLAERLALCRQLFDHHLKRRALVVIWQRRRELKLRLGQGVPTVEAYRNRHALMLALSLWRQRLERHGEDIRTAYRFWAPRTELDILQQWRRRLMQVRQMHSDAANAAYFFVATKSIRRWRDAVAQSKRRKRQAAYAAVRRKHKMALAKHVLYSWRDRLAYLAQMENAALGTYQARLSVLVSGVVAEWRRRVWHATEASAEAAAVRNSALLRTTMLPWVLRARQAQEQSGQAAYQAELLALKRTAALLRKLSLLGFQHRSRERNAEELRSRNDRQHVRRMFWYWRNKAAAARPRDAPQSPRQGPSVEVAGNVAVTPDRRPLDIRDDDGFTDRGISAPAAAPRASAVPGYLTTPINRISRANALLRMSTTPGTPQTNPFQTRLQSQLFTDRRPAATRRPDFSASMPAPKR